MVWATEILHSNSRFGVIWSFHFNTKLQLVVCYLRETNTAELAHPMGVHFGVIGALKHNHS